MQNGDTAAAARYFEKAAALDPKSTRQAHRGGAARTWRRATASAGSRELEAAAAADTGIRADLALVAANMRQRKFDAALAAIDAIEKKQPDKPLPHNLRGAVLLAKGDAAGARRSFERALALDPAYFPAAASLARLDLADKKPDDAKKRFEAVLAKDPKNVQALLAIAALRAQSRRIAGRSRRADRQGDRREPGRADAAAGADLPSICAARSRRRRSRRRRTRSPRCRTDPSSWMPPARRIAPPAKPIRRSRRTTSSRKLRPESPLPFMRMAEVQIAAKDNAAARESLRKALAIKPDSVEAQRASSLWISTGRRTNEALAVARDMQKQRPKESVGYLLEGDIHARQEGVERGGRRLSHRPEAGRARRIWRSGLTSALDAGGNGAEADELRGHRGSRTIPRICDFRHYLAQAAIAKKDYAAAARQYKAMLEIEPNDRAGAQQSRLGSRPAEGPEGARVRGTRQQARSRQSRDPRHLRHVAGRKGRYRARRRIAAESTWRLRPMPQAFASISRGR